MPRASQQPAATAMSQRGSTTWKLRKGNLETAVEYVPRPRQPGLSPVDHWLRRQPAIMAPFISGPDIQNAVGGVANLRAGH